MSWIATLLKGAAATEATAYIATGVLPRAGETAAPERLKADACYVELYVDSLWLPKSRKVTSELHGVVHVYSEVERIGEGKAKIAFVSVPSDLAKVDGKAINKIITQSRKALGPAPWRGDALGLEIGLFSVKSSELAEPYLDLLDSLSQTAGVSFIAAAAPFVPVVRRGMEMLTGKTGDHSLEIGLDTTMNDPMTGSYAPVAADRSVVDEKRLSVAEDGMLLLDGSLLRAYPWLVYRIRQTTERPDFGAIPELKESWGKLLAAIRSRKRSDAADALTGFRIATVTSPDLITQDAETLTKRADEMMAKAFSGVDQNAKLGPMDLPEFRDVALYGRMAAGALTEGGALPTTGYRPAAPQSPDQ